MKKYLKLMRIHHYIKNLLLFVALACSGNILNFSLFKKTLIGFFAFCAISSVVYIINDIRDVEKDRQHPTKCKRPIASGEISVKKAWILAVVLFVVSFVCSVLTLNLTSVILIVLYFILNLCYSFGLKNVALVDVTILVSGFLIRILCGAAIADIAVSNWLYLTVIAIAFYFSFGKRRNELKYKSDGKTRKVLQYYSISFLDKSMYVCLTLANVFYALWSVDETTMNFYNSKFLIVSVPIVLLITLKYSMNIEGNSDGDPVEVLIHDKILLCLCIVYALTMFSILYLPKLFGTMN